MSGVLLVQGDSKHLASAADFVGPHSLDAGETGGDQCVVNHGGLHHAAHVGVVVWRFPWGSAELNGVVTVVNPLDVHGEDRLGATAVIAGPLPERTLGLAAVGCEPTLHDDLTARWD